MRCVKWLTAALLVSALAAGCTDPQREAGRRLAERVDEARRLYNHATVLLADPQYVLDAETGGLSPVTEALEPDAAGKPKVGRLTNPLELLEKARSRLAKALSENAEAPASSRADARLMLGQIQLAVGRYHVIAAEWARTEASRARRETESLLVMMGNRTSLAVFYGSLEEKPRDEIVRMRDSTAKQQKALADQIDAATTEIGKLQGEINALGVEKKKLSAESARHHEQAQLLSGDEGLQEQTLAAEKDRQINQKENEIAARQEKMGYLNSDLARRQRDRLRAEADLGALNQHLADMDKRTSEAAEQKKSAWSEAAGFEKQAEKVAAEVVSHSKTAAAHEERARKALADSLKQLEQAESDVSKEWNAAKRAQSERLRAEKPEDEILAALANDQHLASVMGLEASANLALAELGRYQLETAQVNQALSEALIDAAKLLGQAAPAVAKELLGYVADPAETQQTSEKSYLAAEKDLADILKTHLTGHEVGRNIRWIYEAKLAEAYLGHYLLTRKQPVLDDAKDFVDKATAGKEGSPQLSAVMELKRLILNAPPPG